MKLQDQNSKEQGSLDLIVKVEKHDESQIKSLRQIDKLDEGLPTE